MEPAPARLPSHRGRRDRALSLLREPLLSAEGRLIITVASASGGQTL